MLRVMIAEDELLVRTGLSVSIEWERLDLQLVAETSNGNEAYYAFLQHRPDIVLTDIRMPGMDGLTLIQKIREMDPQCQIIVISCLTDFETLHDAMQYNISSYLIKATMTQEDIESALERAINDCRKPVATPDKESVTARSLSNALTEYVVLRRLSFEGLLERLRSDAVPLPSPDGVLTVYWTSYSAESIMLKTISRMVENALGSEGNVKYLFCDQYLVFMTDAFINGPCEELRVALQDVHFFIQENFTQQLRFIYSSENVPLETLPAYLDQACILGGRSYLFDSPVLAVDGAGHVDESDISRWAIGLQECFACLHGTPKQNEAFEQSVQAVCASLGAPRIDVLHRLYEMTALLAQSVRQITPDLLARCHDYLSQAKTFRSMMSIIEKQLLSLISSPNTPYTRLLNSAIQYMSENLESELTLKQVSSYINLSPGYFSTLLKNETGMRFTEYLGELRLRRAQELLKDGELSINQVAQSCGYADISYFSRSFKKRMGVSPSKWRKT